MAKRRYNITLSDEAHRRLREMARAADISASSFVSLLIARAWAERGASLPAQAEPPAVPARNYSTFSTSYKEAK